MSYSIPSSLFRLKSITPIFFSGPLRIINSRKVELIGCKIGLGWLFGRIRRFEEDRDMGWTLMCLSRKPEDIDR